MIENRPAHLLADAAFKTLPKAPLALDWSSIPELLRLVMLDLSGIQPPTKQMVEAAGGELQDKPSEGEITLFKRRRTEFQFVSVVVSLVAAGGVDGVLQFKPFAVTLIPASKRTEVQTGDIDLVAALDVGEWLKTEPLYTGYDPFSGGWSMYGSLPGYLDGERQGFIDEIGVVIDQFFLATETGNDEILMTDMRMSSEETAAKYAKHRKKLFFTPFKKVEARRVWGAETPIELFLIQALAKEKVFPECQTLIMEDGTAFPSLFHLWRDAKFRNSADVISSVDLYFPTERIAVFCDGSSHSRRERKSKDAAIDAKLDALGIRSVRILGSEINPEERQHDPAHPRGIFHQVDRLESLHDHGQHDAAPRS
jgi:hypothetical protein